MTINERRVQPRFASVLPEREADEIDERDNPVVVAGVGRFGHIVARLLRLNGYGTTVLDHDAEQVETLGRFGIKSYYGDATRLDLLRTAGAEKAQLFVIAIDQEEQALKIADLIREHFPQLRILARATSRQHAYELLRRGVPDVYRETFESGSSSECGRAGRARPAQRPRPARRATLSRTRGRFCPRDGAIGYGGYERLRVHGPSPRRKPGERPGLG